ncbi:unnamed protein product [Soboliphyme baturini]|uniref:DC_STAMP domain-containing protein n=1 Tax=Soboliphyme baturini TaxID=241478 RepID=A0A183ITJ5_9BILA|nr:unnamed protein product [Soboliphyme baturini]
MMHAVSYSREIAAKLPEYISSLEDEISRLEERKEIRWMRKRMQEINAAEFENRRSRGEKNKLIDHVFKLRNATLVQRMSKFRRKLVQRFIEKATFQCEDIINTAFAKCREWFNKKLTDCLLGFPLNPICTAYTLDAVCNVMKMIDFREYHCNSDATDIDKYAEAYGAKIDEAQNLTERLVNSFKLNVQFKARFPFRFPKLISLAQLKSSVAQAFSVLRGFFATISTIFTVISVMMIIYFFIVIISLVEIDKQFYYMLSLVRKYSGVVVSQKGFHDIKVNIEGTGVVAQMLTSMLGNFDRSYSVDQILDNMHCRINPTASSMEDIAWIWGLFAIFVFQCTFGVYLIRFRLLIASLLMPDRQYTRILWLYNNMLRERALFIRQRKIEINRMAMDDEFPPPTFFQMLFGKARCFFCDEKIGKEYHSCWDHEQTLLYCDPCWNELLNQRCVACELQYETIVDEQGRMKAKYIQRQTLRRRRPS